MIIQTRMHTRPNLYTQFFSQMINPDVTTRKWNIVPIYQSLWPKFKAYEPRYTKDVLFKLVILEFEDQETYDALYADAENIKRENALKEEYSLTGVTLIDELRYLDQGSQEQLDYYTWVKAYTWPAKCFIIRSAWDQDLDRFLEDVYPEKPEDDQLIIDPIYKDILTS